MNFGLSREIYGVPWCVDAITYQSLNAILTNSRNGVKLELPEVKYNSVDLLVVNSETRLIQREWQLNNSNEFEGIGILNLNGPITKGGGASSSGMIEMSNSMLSMSADKRIKGFIILGDSGGGSTSAVRIMADTISQVKQTKPVYTLIQKESVLASAAYGIAAPSTKIFAEDGMSMVGSLGTMLNISAKKDNSTDADGTKNIVIYASKSTMKNKPIREAINNDNYDLILSELIDPINENFLSKIISKRPQLSGTSYDDGHVVFSKDAVGTFIEPIASFDQVVEMVLSDAKEMSTNTNTNINNNPNSKMTKEELKQSNPDVYASIATEGAEAQQEIVNSWLPFIEADSKAVLEGIKSGKPLLESQKNVFLVALAQKGRIASLQSDNAPAVVTNESATVVNAEEAKQKEINEIANSIKLT
jgi:ClpP class serine protease